MDWTVRYFLSAEQLPERTGGIYLLFVGELLDYVGQSDDVRRRLTAEHHVYDGETHSLIAFIEEGEYRTRLSLERYFNNKYNPPNSFVGTEKQSEESAEWHSKSAADRRQALQGLAFDDFQVDMVFAEEGKTVEFRQIQSTDNVMGVPSIIALKPKDIRKS
jgi:hypothetical protein